MFGLEPGFTPGPSGLLEPGLAPALPLFMPAACRFPGNPGLASHFGLAAALVEELGGTESALFQLVEVPFNTSWIAHAREGSTGNVACHYISRESIVLTMKRLGHFWLSLGENDKASLTKSYGLPQASAASRYRSRHAHEQGGTHR